MPLAPLSPDMAGQVAAIRADFQQQISYLRDQMHELRAQERDAIQTLLHPEQAASIAAAATRRETINSRVTSTHVVAH